MVVVVVVAVLLVAAVVFPVVGCWLCGCAVMLMLMRCVVAWTVHEFLLEPPSPYAGA